MNRYNNSKQAFQEKALHSYKVWLMYFLVSSFVSFIDITIRVKLASCIYKSQNTINKTWSVPSQHDFTETSMYNVYDW